jgi:pilus assembly protein CpaE
MRAGAQEFLTRPVDTRELGEAVKRLSGVIKRSGTPRRRSGKIVTVFSSKGGVGVTSVSTNLAVSFQRNAKKRTALVDLNMQMGDVGLMLDLRPEYTITDAIGTGNLDETRLRGLMAEHDSGVHFLSTPEDPIEAEKISPGLLLEVFSLMKSMYDVIVVDAGHFFDSRVLEVLSLADTILVIAALDVPTVRNVRRCLTLFAQLGYTQEKVRLVINRHQTKSKVTAEDLEETAEAKIFWSIPNDYKPLIASIDSGVPAIVQSSKSKVSRAIEDLTYELCQLYGEEEVEEPASEEESNEVNQRSASR